MCLCAQAGEPARTVHFVEEGRVLVAANFLNLPEAQRAVDFPETLLTDPLEWCASLCTWSSYSRTSAFT